MKNGRLIDFIERAHECHPRPAVLVIDEINRANVPRVFGELLRALEYRDEWTVLASGRVIRIPSNLELIGTMNNADRSTARLDAALRRRFAFIRIAPDAQLLLRHFGESEQVKALAQVIGDINKQLFASGEHGLGVSFFLGFGTTKDLAQHIEDIWELEVEPLLEEHCEANREELKKWRWSQLIKGQLQTWATKAPIA